MLKINTGYFDNEFQNDMSKLNNLLTKMANIITTDIPDNFEFANQLYMAEESRINAVEQWQLLNGKVIDVMTKYANAEMQARGYVLSNDSSIMDSSKVSNRKTFPNTLDEKKKLKLNAYLYALLSKSPSSLRKSAKNVTANDIRLAKQIMDEDLSDRDKMLYGVFYNKINHWCKTDDVKNTGTAGMYKNKENIYTVYAQGKNDLWADIPYSQKNYEKSACGATSVAIIASNVDPDITPIDAGQKIYKNAGEEFGTNVSNGSVTSYENVKKTLDDYGIKYTEKYSYSYKEINEHLDKGNPILICTKDAAIGNGKVRSGHFVTLLGKNDEGQIFLGDPAEDGSNSGYYDQSKILPAAHSWALFIDYDE